MILTRKLVFRCVNFHLNFALIFDWILEPFWGPVGPQDPPKMGPGTSQEGPRTAPESPNSGFSRLGSSRGRFWASGAPPGPPFGPLPLGLIFHVILDAFGNGPASFYGYLFGMRFRSLRMAFFPVETLPMVRNIWHGGTKVKPSKISAAPGQLGLRMASRSPGSWNFKINC